MTTPEAERHRAFAATFLSVADATVDWSAPTPVEEWQARDIVDHLLDWLPPLLLRWSDIVLPPATGDTPAARWADRATAVQELLDSPDRAAIVVSEGPFAGDPIARLIDRIYTADVYMHTWDLARAGGIEVALDAQYARDLLEQMRPIESVMRESGHYGPPTRTDSDEPVDRLMAFIGRAVTLP